MPMSVLNPRSNPAFEARRLTSVLSGWYVRVAWHNGKREHIPGFVSQREAQRFKRVLGARFGVDLSEVSLGRCLRKLGFSHISARPRHPKQDPEAIATFKKKVFQLACWRP